MHISRPIRRALGVVTIFCAIILAVSCQSRLETSNQPMGEVKSTNKIGPAGMNLEQVQAEVEAFADQYVLLVTEVTNQLSREHPELVPRLHAIKLSIGRGTYIIASGPNPVVSLLDLVVQTTLVHHTSQRTLRGALPEESAAPLLAVFERSRDQAWTLAERVLTPQEIADLRGLIDTWIEQNPNVTYVAGVRFSDFARMPRRQGSTAPTTIFGLLRVDPFASIDPAAREIQESRLLAERMFYYAQRMPQLITWNVESLYYDLARAPQTEQVLKNLNDFTTISGQLNQTIAQLPTRTREELAASEQTITRLLDQMNQSLEQTKQTLQHVDQSSENLRQASQAVADAGKAWQGTAEAVGEVAAIINPPTPPRPPGAPDEPPSEPVTLRDVTTALQEAQNTAIAMRKLLEEFSNTAKEGGFVTSVNSSVVEARREAQNVVITIAACLAALIVMVFACALIYRRTGRNSLTVRSG
jgi:hypothetical protein